VSFDPPSSNWKMTPSITTRFEPDGPDVELRT
jgi:hypothetical protein